MICVCVCVCVSYRLISVFVSIISYYVADDHSGEGGHVLSQWEGVTVAGEVGRIIVDICDGDTNDSSRLIALTRGCDIEQSNSVEEKKMKS